MTYGDGAEVALATLDVQTGAVVRLATDFTNHRSVAPVPAANALAVLAGSPAKPAAVLAVPLGAAPAQVLKVARPATIDAGYISVPRTIEYPTTGGLTAFGYFYAPRNRDFVGPGNRSLPFGL